MSSGDGAAGAVTGMSSSRGNKDRGRKDSDGTGCFMDGLYRDGSRAAGQKQPALCTNKVQAAFKLLAGIIISV